MFWADRIADEIGSKLKDRIAAGPLVIRDEKTASGRVHVGSMRGAAIHGAISEVLTERGIANTFYWEINDFDPMDGLPVYLDEATYRPYMGKPLYTIPSPDLPTGQAGGKAKNYAEYFAQEFTNVIEEAGFHPQYYRASELYFSGRMNGVIRAALLHAETIRRIYKEVSGGEREESWLPLSVICENCGKIGTTRATLFDGEQVTYECGNFVDWAKGCGHKGTVSPFDGNAKLPWKVEWAAKFKVMNVAVELAGKDHYTKGGSREIAERISREVFEYEPPWGTLYEFFLVGGKKMSSSKGAGSSAREIADLLPPHIFRLALLGKEIRQTVDFEPAGDTIPVLFDTYDRLAEHYFEGERDDQSRLFLFVHFPEERKKLAPVFHVRFSQVVFLVQMPHLDIFEEAARIKGSPLTDEEREDLKERSQYAKKWLDAHAPEEYKFELQKDTVPEGARNFSPEIKNAFGEILRYIETSTTLDGQELHTKLHEIRKESGVEAGPFFGALYQSFLGKNSGPKAGWFLSVLDHDFLTKRLEEVSN